MILARCACLLAALLAASLGFAQSAAAAPVPREITPCIARLPVDAGAGAGAVERLIAHPDTFDCGARQTSYGPGNYLVALRFGSDGAPAPAGAAQAPLVLRHTYLWMSRERVLFRYADGSRDELAFDAGEAARHTTVGAFIELPVPVHAAPLSAVYVEVDGAANLRGVMQGAELLSLTETFAGQGSLIALYAGFAGLALALVVYNFALWRALRHKFQLAYCAMVTLLLGYKFTSSGAAMLLFPRLGGNDNLRLNYLLLMAAALAGMSFVRLFFGPSVFTRRLDRAYWGLSTTLLGAGVLFAALAPWRIGALDQIYVYAMAANLLVLIPVVANAARLRSRYLPLFLLGWSFPILATVARVLHGLGLLPYSFWLENGNMLAFVWEALLSSLLITSRLRELSQDRDSARAGEISALRMASADPLTGLLNRRAFVTMATARHAQQRLMLIDIDQFKAINDMFGHDVGDDVLIAVAAAIQSVRPAGGLAVRLGGEEFALMVPLDHCADCLPGDVLRAIARQPMPPGVEVTVSMGYADALVRSEAEWRKLYRLADRALYRAKAEGRNRACQADEYGFSAAA